MAITSPAFIYTFLIATACCLMLTTAEDDVPVATGERESKQIFNYAPQFYPENSQYYYPKSSAFGIPYGSQGALVNNYQAARLPSYPLLIDSPSDDPITPSWRNIFAGGHDKLHWWKKNFQREATISMDPIAAECSVDATAVANILNDGLGPCKYATQAEQGSITIKFSANNQAVLIAITANSHRNSRVKLVCTQLDAGISLFTNSGKINAITDTPRTEMGYMQFVAVTTAAPAAATDGNVRCTWHSYHHYVGLYP